MVSTGGLEAANRWYTGDMTDRQVLIEVIMKCSGKTPGGDGLIKGKTDRWLTTWEPNWMTQVCGRWLR